MSGAAEIRIRRGDNTLEVGFENGAALSLSAEFLRVQPPAESGRAALVHGKRHVSILKAEPFGNYALRLVFSDGFDSGIYSWDYLRELGREYRIRWRRYLHLLEEAGLGRE